MSLNNVSYRELKENIGNVKTEIGELTELPTNDKSSIVSALTEVFTSAGNGKAAVAAAVTGKGVPTSPTDTFAQIAANVGQIATGITPTGTKNISANGTYDVTQYAQAQVNVNAGAALITKIISANGVYNAADDNADGYSSVSVNVPTGSLNSKCFSLTVSEDISGQHLIVNPSGDAEIAAHRSDNSFVVGFMALNAVAVLSTRAVFATNNPLHSSPDNAHYGVYLRSSTSGTTGVYVTKPAGTPRDNIAGSVGVDSTGTISVYASSSYLIRAGNYIVVCGW